MASTTGIIVTYGPTSTLPGTIEALVRHATSELSRILVVTQPDEAGDRQTVPSVAFPLDEIALDENVGFGPANNLAVDRSDTEYVALINPDLVVTEGWLSPLLRALEDPAVAIAAPPLLGADGQLVEAGDVIFSDGGTEAVGDSRWPGGYDAAMFDRDVDYASAACWVMRRDVFTSLGGFDPRFAPAYFEDTDLAMTAWSRDLVTRLVVTRPVIHLHMGADAHRVTLGQRSRVQFEQKWAAQLRRQPERPSRGFDARAARDHRARARVVWVADADPAGLERVADEAASEALVRPRDRVTLVVPDVPMVGRLRRRHRSSGLEIVTTNAGVDFSEATEVRRVPT